MFQHRLLILPALYCGTRPRSARIASRIGLIVLIATSIGASAQSIPQDRDGLEKGEGLGIALPAELNGYPGPKHVIELKDSLGLSAPQEKDVKAFFEEMKSDAVALGKKIILAEESLNYAFSSGRISEDSLRIRSVEIGKLRGQLRAVHLLAHLRTKGILTAAQVEKYMRLRGHVKHAHH